jgi:5-methylcytosine-specific restriction endonuclease McrA
MRSGRKRLHYRKRLIKEYNSCCLKCGEQKEETQLQLHHIIPISQGGEDKYYNVILLCKTCHKIADREAGVRFDKRRGRGN